MCFAEENRNVPILMYHYISNGPSDPCRITPERFKEHMDFLHKNGYTPILPKQLNDYITKGKVLPKKPVLITFDDGYKDNYINAYPVLKKYKFKATFFIITDFIGKTLDGDTYMTGEQLIHLNRNKMSINCHTQDHESLKNMSYKDQYREVSDSKDYLEELISKNVDYLAYPYGDYDQTTLNIAKKVGYKLCFAVNGDHSDTSKNAYHIGRITINPDTTVEQLKIALDSY